MTWSIFPVAPACLLRRRIYSLVLYIYMIYTRWNSLRLQSFLIHESWSVHRTRVQHSRCTVHILMKMHAAIEVCKCIACHDSSHCASNTEWGRNARQSLIDHDICMDFRFAAVRMGCCVWCNRMQLTRWGFQGDNDGCKSSGKRPKLLVFALIVVQNEESLAFITCSELAISARVDG